MKYLLDTNVCIRYLNGRSKKVRKRLRSLRPEEIAVCAVVKAELFAGATRSQNPTRTMARLRAFLAPYVSLPFDDRAAEVYGEIRAQLETAGTPIGPHDLEIAAIALANDLILVTHNTREFGRVPDLRIEDWEA
jgi:tRNA(fMet)-specific endonuclease VapC